MSEQRNWQAEGACTELPINKLDAVFFQEVRYQHTVPALVAETCGRCVVAAECLQDAVDDPPEYGYRAGIGSADLQRMHDGNNVIELERATELVEEAYE